jgi:transposase
VAVDALGNSVRFIVTGGERHDITQAPALIEGLPAAYVLADKAYDSDPFRQDIQALGAQAVIPLNRTRARYDNHDRHLYKERNLVERFFNKLKHFRRIATRYEQTARAYLSMVQLAAVVIWTR